MDSKVSDKSKTQTTVNSDVMRITVPANTRMSKPMTLTNELKGGEDTEVNRVQIKLGCGAEAAILMTDRAVTKEDIHHISDIEVIMEEGAHLDMYELEETHTRCHRQSRLVFHVGRNCTLSHTNITLFNGETENRINVLLEGEHSEVTLNGCVVIDKNQKVDNITLIDHQQPNCVSHELYKYVVDGESRGGFDGKILVRPGAQNTVSTETNNNICASHQARMNTKPVLEIYADDVRCSHGSTVGVLDENALFYMQQRGLSVADARMLLMYAFVGQVIDSIRLAPLRDRLHMLVEKRLRGELDKCIGCALCK